MLVAGMVGVMAKGGATLGTTRAVPWRGGLHEYHNAGQAMDCRTGRRCEVAALPGALYARDPVNNEPGAAGYIDWGGVGG